MAFPYMIQRIKRQPLAVVLLFGLNFVTALLLCVLHTGSIRLNEQIDAVYDNATVTCQVSSITGTQCDNLHLPEWVIRLFFGKSCIPNSSGISFSDDADAERFLTYIADAYAKVSIKGQFRGGSVNIIGITDIEADRALQEENGCYITWQEPFNDAIFSGSDEYCVIPKTMLTALSEAGNIEINFQSGDKAVTREFLAVGAHTGADDVIYCPWGITAQINRELDGAIHAAAITAVLRDSRSVPEFWENATGNYFVEPNPEGELTPWEESPIYNNYPYALLVNDDKLEGTVSGLQNNLSFFRLCTTAMIVLSLIVGLVAGHLIVRKRTRALALQQILGRSNGNIFAEILLELAASTAIGIITGIGLSCLMGVKDFPWSALLASPALCILGIASAIISILHKDLIRTIKEDA